ncbi:hypothetical protein CGZ95_18270 [Enemella evansiae]|uniref:hypothetical protein n=1 Tax=Enemella evansiae TaxID=2016499 RepID=UPI000B965F19|nr:hypothetical protein [Enemella evansiae]OYN94447.1 hypothetical protein CGZ95_18270 [Enemella evansiae]
MSWQDYSQTDNLAQRADQARADLEDVPGFHTVGITEGRVVASGTGSQFASAAQRLKVSSRILPGLPNANELAQYLKSLPQGQVYALGKDLDGYVITVDQKVLSSVDTAPAGVRVVAAPQAPKARAAIGGGQNLTASNGSTSDQCQTGLAVTDPQGQPGILTAGHCTRDGAYTQFTVTQPDGSSTKLGALGWNQFGLPGNQPMSSEFSTDPTDYGTDLAIISPGAGNSTTAQVPTSTQNSSGHISAVANPALGLPVCMRSRAQSTNNGWRCGTIAAEQARYADTNTFADSPRGVNVFTVKNLEAADGDSGAPVLAHNTAIGIVSAGGVEGQTQVVYAVPVNTALSTYRPNTHIKLWVSQPTLDGSVPAGTNWATAAWRGGQTVTGKVVGDEGETVSGMTIEARLDGNLIVTTTTDTTGSFSVRLPSTMDETQHTITVTARRGGDSAEPLSVALPFIVDGAIRDNWVANGGPDGMLGRPAGPAGCDLPDNGCWQQFSLENAKIHSSASTGAHFTRGQIQDKWAETGWEKGALGYPVIDESCGLVDGGCWQLFQKDAAIYWTAGTGARYTQGLIRQKYGEAGWEHGILGYPTNDHNCDSPDRCSQEFQGGQIYYSAGNGTFDTRGEIGKKYKNAGGPWLSDLGWPRSDETCDSSQNLCSQDFEKGRIYWSRYGGTWIVKGAIWEKFRDSGTEQGVGLPTSDEECTPDRGICWQNFTNGNGQIRWYRGASAYIIRGEILNKWRSLGGDGSLLGRPTGDESCGLLAGGCYQSFAIDGGMIYWQASSGAHYIRGAIKELWARTGWERGTLGYPSTDERCGLRNGGCEQLFATDRSATQNARTISWSPGTGAVTVQQPRILDKWSAAGREGGRYGYPREESNVNQYGIVVQPFEVGWIENN